MYGFLALCLIGLVAASPLPFDFPKPAAGGTNWAVLVAGSNEWYNYRHQADICHSYQILHQHGITDDHIIVFMYDDIAANSQNPTKGTIINKPNGPDVYHGVPKDYTGAKVTPTNFLNALKGTGTAGKVLQSGPNDNVFVFFSDHGGPGIIAFPNELLQASDLIAALKYMNTNKKYKNLVFYLEACESGSMFDGLLPNNINIYATTASDPTTSSYACYYDEKRQTYLGDVYSVNWMENSDVANFKTETLDQQYQIVKKETNTSAVCEYGQLALGSSTLNLFQGNGNTEQLLLQSTAAPSKADAVDSRDVRLAILKNRLAAATSASEKSAVEQELMALLQRRAQIEGYFFAIAQTVAGAGNAAVHMNNRLAVTPNTLSCVESSAVAFHNQCVNLGQEDYGLKFTMSFVSLCDAGFSAETIKQAITTVCANNAAAGLVNGSN